MTNNNNNIYGMVGLLKAIRENDELVIGHDLNKMGLDFSTKKKYLHKTFWGPWTPNEQVTTVDPTADVPAEYRSVSLVRDKLPELKTRNLPEDALFYLFYNFPGDVCQLAAASELIKRKWRFHKIRKVWLISALPMDTGTLGGVGDLGECLCCYFDPLKWRKETQTINLRANELEMNFQSVLGAQQPKFPTISTPTLNQHAPTKTAQIPINFGKEEKINRPSSSLLIEQPSPADSCESTLKFVLSQLNRISQGVTIPKTELRFLTNFLTENPEILANYGNHFFNFMQYEPEIAGLLLAFQLMYDSAAFSSNLDILLNMSVTSQTLIVVNRLVKFCEYKSLSIPSEFLNKFISLCISTCDRDPDQDNAAYRLVRMVCVFLDTLLGHRRFDPTKIRAEIQNFATSYLALREASQLYQKTLQL